LPPQLPSPVPNRRGWLGRLLRGIVRALSSLCADATAPPRGSSTLPDAPLAAADQEARAAVLEAERRAAERLTGVNREIGAGKRRLEQIKGEIANTLAKCAV
jgi:hypothetical protein